MIEEITENVKDQMSISSKFQEFHQLIHQGFLKKLQFGEDRPYTKADFSSDLNNRLDILNQLHLLLTTQKSLDVNDCEFKKSVLVPIVLLCGENVQPSDWTTSQHIQISYIILTVLKREIFKEDSITKIFQVHPEFLQWSLTELRLKLGSQNEWKNYPGAQYCFSWLLRQLNSFRNLPEFLPFVLKFGDDWEIKNKIFALHCLQHILENSTKSDLVKFGYDQVLKSTLFQLLTFRELELCKVTFPVIFKFLKMCWPKIGNVQFLIHFMTFLHTRWRFDNYTKANIVKIVYIQFIILTIFFCYKIAIKKNHSKIRGTLFTFLTTFILTRFFHRNFWVFVTYAI